MVELYIDGHKADLTTTVTVPMNYELEKLENPTIIKNNFSKTISLQATQNNNKIFGYYYELDKLHTGSGFNAIKRVPFELYRDNDLVETGYLQLNNIKYKNNTYTYEITLYGGLGDFFYSLAYDEEGNEKTLADLFYGFGENDEDFKFRMNADSVMDAWTYIYYDDNTNPLGYTVNFIPSYNGLYDNFDNNKALINTFEQTIFPNNFSADGKTYNTINGYGMAELNEEMTEWQIRDLRCYKQRPALRLKKFVEAICNPINNGGYEVELDQKYFFNEQNNYYDLSWIALPILNPDSEEWPQSTTDIQATSSTSLSVDLTGKTTTMNVSFTQESLDAINNAGGNSTINIDCDFSLTTVAESSENILLQCAGGEEPKWSGIGVWLEAQANGTTIGISDCVILTKGMQYTKKRGKKVIESYYKMPTINTFDNASDRPKTNFIYYDGYFMKRSGNNYEWSGILMNGNEKAENATYSNTFRLSLKDIRNYENLKFVIKTTKWQNYNMYIKQPVTNPWGETEYISVPSPYVYTSNGSGIKPTSMNLSQIIYPSASINVNSNRKTLQDAVITKHQLLKNKITPASLLLSFTKLFGLYFVKDAKEKKIKVLTKNSFFENGDTIDISGKIDYSNEVKIEPLMFNKKWYALKCPALETTKMKDYKADYYEAEYGQKRINTNYNFNTDEEDIYKDNQYQNIITMLDSSKYYKNFYGTNNAYAPTFGLYGCKYGLWYDGDIETKGEKEMGKYDILEKGVKPVQFGPLVCQDAFPKLCCFDADNDKQNLNDLSVSLVFYNYDKTLSDNEGNPIWYTISNDLPIMETVNEGNPMYLWSETEYDINDELICYRTSSLPQFTRYDFVFDKILNSYDFGLPYETYINAEYEEQSTLYNKFWKNFYNDQFSENTRKVTAYVIFDDIELGNHSLSNFYYFDNCYWILNKIIDYDIANPTKKVKCEFIKVNNIANYTDGQEVVIPYYEFDAEYDGMDEVELLENDTKYGGTFKVRVKPDYGLNQVLMDMNNTTKEEREKKLSIVEEDNGYYLITVSDIVGDGYIYISGYRETDLAVNFNPFSNPPAAASVNTFEIATGDDKEIVWSNKLSSKVTGEYIRFVDFGKLYFRIAPYSGTQITCLFTATFKYYDGHTETKSISLKNNGNWVGYEYNAGNTPYEVTITTMSFTIQ